MTAERLWGYRHAFDHPLTVWIVAGLAAALAFGALAIEGLRLAGRLRPALAAELRVRTRSWMFLVPVMAVPILLGAAWLIAAVAVLGLLCYREFARATGLFRERLVSSIVVVGILAVNFAALDHWYNFFMALIPLTMAGIAVVSIPRDRPHGYIQRVALGVFGFLLCGSALAHLAYMANDWNYRPIVFMLLLSVGASDVFAFVVGKSIGGPKLVPATSPNKTVSGAVGALLLTVLVVYLLTASLFPGTAMDGAWHRLGLGFLIGAFAQLGDLMLSSIKRDLGIKDIGAAIPGHGGILDRFNSLLLVAPVAFHYVGYFRGFGLDQPTRIISGG
jgi:phosphatidate cytidylyltransferase